MSVTLAPGAGARAAEPRSAGVAIPWVAGGALLLAEYLLTSYAVDIRPLAQRSDWLGVFGSAGSAGPILLSAATATVLIGGRRLLAEIRTALVAPYRVHGPRSALERLASLAIHFGGFAAFLFLTVLFSQVGEELPSRAGLLAGAWIGSIVVALLALIHAVVPLPALVRIGRGAGPALATGAALGLVAWAAGVATVRFWDPLSEPTLRASAAMLQVVGSDVAFDTATLELTFQGFEIVIEPVCSGYEGIGLLAVLLSAYLWGFRAQLRFPHVLILLPVGITLSWLANVLRISGLMLIGARWSEEFALGSFHSKAGWLLFCALALGLVTASQRLGVLARRIPSAIASAHGAGGGTRNPTADYLLPLLALVGAQAVLGPFSHGLELLYPAAGAIAAFLLLRFRARYPEHTAPRSTWTAIGAGLFVFVIWTGLETTHAPGSADAARSQFQDLPAPARIAWLALRYFASVLVVPAVEEIAFRGYLLRRIIDPNFVAVPFTRLTWMSVIVSSFAFALLHQDAIAAFASAVIFALVQARSGRLGDAIVAHAVANAGCVSLDLARHGWWSLL